MNSESSERTMHIGELADRTGLSLRTIRHYDEVGLLPASARTEGGFRVYSAADLERLILIRRMKPLGFSLEEMGELLGVVDQLAGSPTPNERTLLHQQLDSYIDAAGRQREKLALNLKRADEFLELLENRRSAPD